MNWYTAYRMFSDGDLCPNKKPTIAHYEHNIEASKPTTPINIPICDCHTRPIELVDTDVEFFKKEANELFLMHYRNIMTQIFETLGSKVRKLDEERREYHFQLKKLFGSHMLSVQLALDYAKSKYGDIRDMDEEKANVKIWDMAYFATEYMIRSEIEIHKDGFYTF